MSVIDRRLLLAGGLMLPAAALAAKLAPPDAEVSESPIHWPIGGGRELHGFMAISARARGRQPAVLVIGGHDTPDIFSRALVHSVAQAGFVACTVNVASLSVHGFIDDMRATARWLANGRYGTGRIGAIGLAGGVDPTIALVADGTLAAAATFGGATPSGESPILSFRPAGTGWRQAADQNGPVEWAQAWPVAVAYLRTRLI